MGAFKGLSLRYKIFAIALTGAIGFVAYLGYSVFAQQNIESSLKHMEDVSFPLTEQIDRSGLLLFRLFLVDQIQNRSYQFQHDRQLLATMLQALHTHPAAGTSGGVRRWLSFF